MVYKVGCNRFGEELLHVMKCIRERGRNIRSPVSAAPGGLSGYFVFVSCRVIATKKLTPRESLT